MCNHLRVKNLTFVLMLGCFLADISCLNDDKPAADATTKKDERSSVSSSSVSPPATDAASKPTIPPNQPSPAPVISFTLEHKDYNLKLYSDQSGVIEQFKTTPKVSEIKYEIDGTTDKKQEGIFDLDADSGVLRIKEKIPTGEYKFSVKASSTKDSSKTSTAKVTVKVLEVTVCEGKDSKPLFANAFVKKHISESKAEILVAENSFHTDKCQYSVLNQKPAGEFFVLNSASGKLESNDKIDRENEVFKSQVQAHISLELYIKCSEGKRKRSVRDTSNIEHTTSKYMSNGMLDSSQFNSTLEQIQVSMDGNILGDKLEDPPKKDETPEKKEDAPTKPEPKEHNCYDSTTVRSACDSIIEDKIIYNTQVMNLLVLIDDVNDNAPEFTEKEYFFGYPNKNLFTKVIPDNVGVVYATDKDEGINAAVKYSIKDKHGVVIDPCTGVIFPHYAHFTYDKMTFEVTATDKDGKSDGLSKSVPVTVDILQGYHILKMLVKRPLGQSNKDIITKLEEHCKVSVRVLKIDPVPSLEEISGSIELETDGFDIMEYYAIYAHEGQTLKDMNEILEQVKKSDELMKKILWTSVLAGSPYHYVQSKGLFSGLVVVMLILCIGSLVFYMTYIRTGKYYQCFNYFKKTDSTTPLERDEGSIGTSDYVVSFARMNHVNPTFNVVETDGNKDFRPVTLKAFDLPGAQIMNVDELTPAPPILVNSNSNSRRNSLGGEDNLSLSVANDTRARRKSTVSFNEIVEQYHTVP